MAEALTRSTFRIGGMDCASCAAKIDAATRRAPGVREVDVSVATASMTVAHLAEADLAALQRRIAGLGYTIAPAGPNPAGPDPANADTEPPPWWREGKNRLVIASGTALALAWSFGRLLPWTDHWGFAAAMLVGLVPIAWRAAMAARSGTPFSIEMLMSIAALGALAIGASEEGAVVVFLFLVGELLEGAAARRARASIQGLMALVPDTVLVERDGGTVATPAAQVIPGSVILVRPGDRIGADGEVVEGASHVDEAAVTGEGTPRRKATGDAVFAGTVNGEGALRVRVLVGAADNTVARIVRLVAQAQAGKAPTERLIERFSRAYTPAVVLIALLAALVPPLLAGADWDIWIYRSLALLLIGCPCALVISTPAAIAAALATGARRGLLVKSGAALEALAGLTDIALDKTGTLTEGRPAVTDLIAPGGDPGRMLAMAAALESGASHPIAQAILRRAEQEGAMVLPAREIQAVLGEGIEGVFGGKRLFLGAPDAAARRTPLPADATARIDALRREGKTVAVLLAEDGLAGIIALRDSLRADAAAGVAALKASGVRPVILTGDHAASAVPIAAELGVEARAGLLPADKQAIVAALRAEGRRVGKVGDGINDAPALAAADVGIAMGGGTDVALETADAAVLHGRVLDIPRMILLARAALANIRQNVAVALGLKLVFLATTLAGVTGLWPAILADTGATVLVTANALRLLAWRDGLERGAAGSARAAASAV